MKESSNPVKATYLDKKVINTLITRALQEDIGSGDHSSLAAIDSEAQGKADLLMKEDGIIAGLEVALQVFNEVDPQVSVDVLVKDGDQVKTGDKILSVSGRAQSILSAERLALNFLQRMSGIATKTARMVEMIAHTNCQLLDTRKTTPNFRIFEKWAVLLGGGRNHRFALYDMIMLKDNHNDYSGGITMAVSKSKEYLLENNLDLKIEVETRNLDEVEEALNAGADIIMLDNMTLDQLSEAVTLVGGKVQTEASGGITESTITSIAETGVDYISVGALTHSYKSLDMSLKASLA